MSEILEVIARCKTHNVPQKEIAEIVGLSEGRVSQLMASPEFQAVHGRIVRELAQRVQETEEGWDALEHQAVRNLQSIVKHNRDPELNLRVATMANRAVRRSRPGGHILDASGAASRAVLELTQRTIERLSAMRPGVEQTAKLTVSLSDADVRSLLDRSEAASSPSRPSSIERLMAAMPLEA